MESKKLYLAPSITLMTAETSSMLSTSNIDYGGGNTGGDKPHVAESNFNQYDTEWDDEE